MYYINSHLDHFLVEWITILVIVSTEWNIKFDQNKVIFHYQIMKSSEEGHLEAIWLPLDNWTNLYHAERLGTLELWQHGLEEEVEVLAEPVARPLDQRRHQATHERRCELATHGVQQLTGHLWQQKYT